MMIHIVTELNCAFNILHDNAQLTSFLTYKISKL